MSQIELIYTFKSFDICCNILECCGHTYPLTNLCPSNSTNITYNPMKINDIPFIESKPLYPIVVGLSCRTNKHVLYRILSMLKTIYVIWN